MKTEKQRKTSVAGCTKAGKRYPLDSDCFNAVKMLENLQNYRYQTHN